MFSRSRAGTLTIGKDMEQDDPQPEGEADALAARRDGVDWEAIKHAVIDGDWSLRRIAEAHGVGETTIRTRMQKERWVRLAGTKPLPSGRRAGATPGVPKEKRAKPKMFRRRQMVQRLFQVLDAKLTEIEKRMAAMQSGEATASAADAERDARSLGALARVYAKLVELDEAAKQGGHGSTQESAKERSEDADRLRQDLALRLKRLDQPGNA